MYIFPTGAIYRVLGEKIILRIARLAGLLVVASFMTIPATAHGSSPAAPANRPKEQGAQSGLPLSYYCNSVPDLGISRSDAVDNWVKICTVYFKAHPNQPRRRQRPKNKPRNRRPGK